MNATKQVEEIMFTKASNDFRLYAIAQHKDQKYGNLPYAYHLSMVECLLAEFGYHENKYAAAAWLHDAVEDTDTSVSDLINRFSPEIAGLVWSCTGEGTNRKERNKSIYQKLKVYPSAAPVKVADRLANTLHGHATNNAKKLGVYIGEWDEFRESVKPLMTNFGETRAFLLWNTLEDKMDTIRRIYGR